MTFYCLKRWNCFVTSYNPIAWVVKRAKLNSKKTYCGTPYCLMSNVRMFFHCFSLGNVERVKIGEAGKLAEASDVVVGQVQVRQGHQVWETLNKTCKGLSISTPPKFLLFCSHGGRGILGTADDPNLWQFHYVFYLFVFVFIYWSRCLSLYRRGLVDHGFTELHCASGNVLIHADTWY